MRKTLGGLVLLAALGGCVSSQPGSFMSHVGPGGQPNGAIGGCCNGSFVPQTVPGVVGAMGEPIPMRGDMRARGMPSDAEMAARQTFAASLPPEIVQQVVANEDSKRGAGLLQAGAPPGGGVPPGVGPLTALPGPVPPVGSGVPGAVAAVGALTGGPPPLGPGRTSIRFLEPRGMKVSWYAPAAGGPGGFAPTALQVPGRYNFPQAAVYRLKLTDIPGFAGVDLYPTLEVVPANNRTATFLAHSSVPLIFTREDFEQVVAGNYLVKVIYLPYERFQDLAVAAPGEIVSTRLEPGADPIAEALQRGSILMVVRMGNIDLEAPGTPAMDAPSPFQKPPMPPALPPGLHGQVPPGGMFPGMPGPGPMVPYGMAGAPGMAPPGMPPRPGMPMMMPGMIPPGVPGSAIPPPGMRPVAAPNGAVRAMPVVPPQAYRAPTPDEKGAGEKKSWLPSFLDKRAQAKKD